MNGEEKFLNLKITKEKNDAILLGEFRIGNFSFSDETWKKWLFGSLFLLFIVDILYVEFEKIK